MKNIKTYCKNFIDDKEKMLDFAVLSKDDFLEFYSYLTEDEYMNTLHIYNDLKRKGDIKNE